MKTIERLLEMIHLLGGGRVWSVQEIAGRFGVSERTVYRDLGRLEEARVPIVRWDDGYRLTPDARLRPLNLTHEERAMLVLALKNPSLRTNDLHVRRADLLAAKLGTMVRDDRSSHALLAGPERGGAVPHVILDTVEVAIDQSRVLEMQYVSLSSGSRQRAVEPWTLVHRDGVWYLAGNCRDNGALRFFRADRIESARMTGEAFERPDDPRIEETLRRSWSIYQGETLFEIVIRFDPELAPLIAHAHHHEEERIEPLETGEIEYRVALTHLDEIARWILGFGGHARAIAPESLRDRVRELAEGTLAVHGKRRGPKRAEEQESVGQVGPRTGRTRRTK